MSHVSADATFKDGMPRLLDPDGYRKAMKRAKWQEGEELVVRVEPKEDAYTYTQLKHYWGHVVTPLSEWNGEFKEEWHLRLKLDYLPEGKTSLTQLNKGELADFILQCEVYAHQAHPEAFAVVGHGD